MLSIKAGESFDIRLDLSETQVSETLYLTNYFGSGALTQHAVLDGDGNRHPYELELDSGGYWWVDASAKSTDQDGITSIFEFDAGTAGEAAAIEVEKFDSDGKVGETELITLPDLGEGLIYNTSNSGSSTEAKFLVNVDGSGYTYVGGVGQEYFANLDHSFGNNYNGDKVVHSVTQDGDGWAVNSHYFENVVLNKSNLNNWEQQGYVVAADDDGLYIAVKDQFQYNGVGASDLQYVNFATGENFLVYESYADAIRNDIDFEILASPTDGKNERIEIIVTSRNSPENDAYSYNYETAAFTLEKSDNGGFDQFISEYSFGASSETTANIYGDGPGGGEDIRDLNLEYLLFENDPAAIAIPGGSSGESIGIASQTALGENAVNTGQFIEPVYEIDSHDLAEVFSLELGCH